MGTSEIKRNDSQRRGLTIVIIGEIRKAGEIGYKSNSKFIWAACLICGKERWVLALNLKINPIPAQSHCAPCSWVLRRKAGTCNWKGGRRLDRGRGYILNNIYPEDFSIRCLVTDIY